jgi:Protein of unknown function (DUF2442)
MIITKIIPKNDLTLQISAKNGMVGIFDIKPYLELEAFIPLKEFSEFSKIINEKYYIEWECGADLSADTIEAQLQ